MVLWDVGGSIVCPTLVGSAGGIVVDVLAYWLHLSWQLANWGSAWVWLSLSLGMADSW